MFDTWGGKIYPRPYDMDTQMGENNQGQDMVFVGGKFDLTVVAEAVQTENVTFDTDTTNDAYEAFQTVFATVTP